MAWANRHLLHYIATSSHCQNKWTCRRGIRGPAGALQEFDTGIQAGCVVDVYGVAVQEHQELYVPGQPASRLRRYPA